MATAAHPVYIFLLMLVSLHLGLGQPVNIELTTHYQDDVISNSFNIRCSLGTTGNCAKNILVLKVTKDVDKTISGIQRDDSIFYGSMLQSSVTTEGHVDIHQKNRTFFSLTVRNAVREDSGLYSCVLVYLDEYGSHKEDAASTNVSVQDQDLKDVVRHLLVKVSLLENMFKSEQENGNERFASLEEKSYKQEDEIKQMNTLVTTLRGQVRDEGRQLQEIKETQKRNQKENSFSSAFSVYGTEPSITTGQTLVFQHSMLNMGDDYDMKSGVYTAPRKGLYVFHLSLFTFYNDDKYVHLKVNDAVVAQLNANHQQLFDQSSVDIVVSLDAGDRVWPHVAIGGKLAAPDQKYTVFNGYILQLL